jgi:hypothetical protein
VTDATPGSPHRADPSALEDPVHHDVAEHELHEEQADEEGAQRDGPADDPDSLPPTGDERVDAAVTRLRDTADSPPEDHVAIYEDVHRRLQDTLADLDRS